MCVWVGLVELFLDSMEWAPPPRQARVWAPLVACEAISDEVSVDDDDAMLRPVQNQIQQSDYYRNKKNAQQNLTLLEPWPQELTERY